MTDLPTLIKEVLTLDSEATKAPWYYPGDGREIVKDAKGGTPITNGRVVFFDFAPSHAETLANCRIISHYRTSAPRLARALEKAITVAEAARDLLAAQDCRCKSNLDTFDCLTCLLQDALTAFDEATK